MALFEQLDSIGAEFAEVSYNMDNGEITMNEVILMSEDQDIHNDEMAALLREYCRSQILAIEPNSISAEGQFKIDDGSVFWDHVETTTRFDSLT